jgi:hypothetical protein
MANIVHQFGGSELSVRSGGSINVESGGGFFLGNTQVLFGSTVPTVSASPGSLYIYTNGSASNWYINTSDGGAAGSAWSSGCINKP